VHSIVSSPTSPTLEQLEEASQRLRRTRPTSPTLEQREEASQRLRRTRPTSPTLEQREEARARLRRTRPTSPTLEQREEARARLRRTRPTSPTLEQREEARARLRRTRPTSLTLEQREEASARLRRTSWLARRSLRSLGRLGEVWRSRAFLIASAPLIVFTAALAAQNTPDDLSKDQDYREELGVNEFTAPSIEKLFNTLDSLKPIPVNALVRPVTELNTADRSKYALSFGVLIGDGFLDVEAEQNKDVEALGRELIRRAKVLGVEERVSRHSRKLLDLAKQNDWERLRKELIVTQEDVEKALLELRDEPIVHLLSLGGWIRGLQIGAASVAADYSPDRAKTLRNIELLDYYLDRLNTLSPRLKRSELIQKITAQLQAVRAIYADNEVLSASQVNSIQATATSMVDLIEK
jgi:hypothetical protein